MSITWANCKNAKTPGGTECSGWSLFKDAADGGGYCRYITDNQDGVDFHLYARLHSPKPSAAEAETCSVTMYLFARKSSTTTASYNNDYDSKVKFTFGNVSDTITLNKSRVGGKDDIVRCIGYATMDGVTVASLNERPFSAVWYGIDGTTLDKTFTISGDKMKWGYGDIALTLAAGTNVVDAGITGIPKERKIRTSHVWYIKNDTAGNDYNSGSATAIGINATSTTDTASWTTTAGNKYTVKWETWLRNYDPDTDSSKRVCCLCRKTKSITCDQLTGTLTLDGTAGNITKTFTYGASNGSVAIGGVGGTVSITSESNTSVANGTLASQTSLTVDPGSVGTATIKLKRAASTQYSASPERTVTVTVNRSYTAVLPSAVSGLVYNGNSQTGISGGSNWEVVSGYSTTATNAGTHTVKVKPKAGYGWKDTNNTAEREVTFTIAKANGYVTLNATTKSVNANSTTTVKISTCHSLANISSSMSNSNATRSRPTDSSATDDQKKTITITGVSPGTSVLTVTCAATTNYKAASATCTITINAIDPGLSVSNKTIKYGANGSVTATSNSSGAITPTSGNTDIFKVSGSGKTITIIPVKPGSATLSLSQAANGIYSTDTASCTITISKGDGYLVISPTTKDISVGGSFTISATSSHGGSLSASTSNGTVAEVNGMTIVGVNKGQSTITVTCAETTYYTAKTATCTVNVGTIGPGLSFSDQTLKYGESKQLSVSTNSAGAITATSSNTSIFTTSMNGTTITLTPTGIGSATLTLNQVASGNYNSGQVTATITVNRNPLAQMPTARTGLVYNESSQSGLNGSGSYITPTSNVTSGTNAGTYTFKATPQTGYCWSDTSGTEERSVSFEIAKAPCDLQLSATSISVGISGQTATITVTRKGNGTITASSSNTSYFTVSGTTTITITGGSTPNVSGTLTVNVAEGTNHLAASATCTVNVTGKLVGYVTWSPNDSSVSKKETQTYTYAASSHHGGTVTASSSNTNIASVSVSGNNITITALRQGTATISSYVGETSTYTASPTKSFTFTVRPAEFRLGNKDVPVYIGDRPVRRIYVGSKIIL